MSDCESANWIPAAAVALAAQREARFSEDTSPPSGAGRQGGRKGLQLSLDGDKVSRERRYGCVLFCFWRVEVRKKKFGDQKEKKI